MPAFYVAGEESALHLPKVREIEERAMCVVHRNAVRFLLKFPCMCNRTRKSREEYNLE